MSSLGKSLSKCCAVAKMLSDKNFYNFLCQINYFELDGQAILEQKNFKCNVSI